MKRAKDLINQNCTEGQRLRTATVAGVGAVFQEGNTVEILKNGDEIFPSMLEAIRTARQSIEFVTFVYWEGKVATDFAQALADAAGRGVRTRVILDAFGSMPMRNSVIELMNKAGVEIERFRPMVRWKLWESDHRTHRKILIVDNKIGFTGGVGIADEWRGDARDESEWRDTHFRIEGPAVVPLRAAFLTDWRDTGHAISAEDVAIESPPADGNIDIAVIDGSAQIGINAAGRLVEAVAAAAEDRILIETPYFNPNPELAAILTAAVARGATVEVLVPGPHIDKRISEIGAEESYLPLAAAGVKIWIYQRSMMHVKAIMVDGKLSIVGSVNVNQRSISKDEEVAIALADRTITETLEQHFDEDRQNSVLAEPRDDNRGLGRKLLGKVLAPIRREI